MVPPSERRAHHRLPTEHRRSLALTLAGHPQRSADTAKAVTARREPDSRPRHTVISPPGTPVASTRKKTAFTELVNNRQDALPSSDSNYKARCRLR